MTDMERKAKCFPVDCRGCTHYHSWDMSVDDWTNVCDILNAQVDDCDIEWTLRIICPLELKPLADCSDGEGEKQ